MTMFGRHVSTQVAQALWSQRDDLLEHGRMKSREVTATVLFADFVNFTGLAEKMEPPALMEWLNRYLEAFASTVEAHGGMVNKFIGDAVMAIFGLPVARTNPQELAEDARCAVRCALAMRQAIQQLNEASQREGLPPVRLRVGIHTGPLVVGTVGSSRRLEYTVIGDTVNATSRIESCEKERMEDEIAPGGCRIFVSETTHAMLGDGFATTSVALLVLRGRTQPLQIHAVVAAV
jgi:adenylate cyclase